MSNDVRKESISVDFGVQVIVPIARWESLKSVEAEKEKYALHIREGQDNVAKFEKQIKELQSLIADGKAISDSYEALQEESRLKDERIVKLEAEISTLIDQTKDTGSLSEALSKAGKAGKATKKPAPKKK